MKPNQEFPSEEGAVFEELRRLTEKISPEPEFQAGLESSLRRLHKPPSRFQSIRRESLQFAGLLVAMLALAVFLSWLFRSLAPVRVPAADSTRTFVAGTGTPEGGPVPQGEGVDWRGTKLFIHAGVPDGPSEASVFLAQPETPATLESVHQLADRFGIQGEVYEMRGELPGLKTFLVTDGKQRLEVRSDLFFTYYPDFPAWNADDFTMDVPDVEAQVDGFMQAHGFAYPYRLEPSLLFGGYQALDVAEDGAAFRHDYFRAAGLLFNFGKNGISWITASLLKREPVGNYPIISAQEALNILIGPDYPLAGMLENGHSSNGPFQSWHRTYPLDQPITLRGWLQVYPPLTGQEPLATLEGTVLRGDTSAMHDLTEPVIIEADGQLHVENGIEFFDLTSWRLIPDGDMGLMGTLEQQGDQVVLVTQDGLTLRMPDIPAGVTLPLENVYALGTQVGDTYEWRSIDLRAMGGGGGGGGGSGLYSLNLSGTPIPFPTASMAPAALPAVEGNTYPYTVVEGDTLSSIAAAFGRTPEELMRINGFTDPGTLFVGQVLLIPGPASSSIEAMRGLVNVTVFQHADTTQENRYTLVEEGGGNYFTLEGNLAGIEAYHNRPVLIWGTAQFGQDSIGSVLVVDRFEPVHPEVDFQVVRATVQSGNAEGQPVNLLTLEDGQTYIAMFPDGTPQGEGGSLGSDGTALQAEVLILPDESFGGYPALRVFGSSSLDQGDGQPFVLEPAASRPYVIDDSQQIAPEEIPTATIEKIELVYFIVDPRYKPINPDSGPAYIQPMWRFSGRYSNGSEFEVLVQALQQQYLSPEVQMLEGPG